MLLEALKWVSSGTPLVNSLASYPWGHHKDALKKFFVLWSLSLLPGVFSVILFPSAGTSTFLKQLASAFTPAEQFVYAVSFLSPMLYLLWERNQHKEKYITARKRTPATLPIEPRGFGFVLYLALVMFIFTAFAFGAAKASQELKTGTFNLNASTIAVNLAIWVYLYGVFCWYLTILMSIEAESIDYSAAARQEESQLGMELHKRVKPQEAN